MKKLSILVAVAALSMFVFCSKDSPTSASSSTVARDSIVLDLYSFSFYNAQQNFYMNREVTLTPLGQSKFKPLDPNVVKPLGDSVHVAIVPKYVPKDFECYVHDSIPLVNGDSANANVLCRVAAISSFTFYQPDTVVVNPVKAITSQPISYVYGHGFVLDQSTPLPWGLGTIKIYYNR